MASRFYAALALTATAFLGNIGRDIWTDEGLRLY